MTVRRSAKVIVRSGKRDVSILVREQFPHRPSAIEHCLLQTAVLLLYSVLINKATTKHIFISEPDMYHRQGARELNVGDNGGSFSSILQSSACQTRPLSPCRGKTDNNHSVVG